MSEEVLPRSRTVCYPTLQVDWSKFSTIRQFGMKTYLGFNDAIIGRLYSRMDTYSLDNSKNPEENHGGIFNLEFSLDGRILAAACERNSVLIHDAHNQKLVKVMKNAHLNCVNCIRFLNDRLFATCSDDSTIKLWDVRNLKDVMCNRTLSGHSNWVKNIEYSEKDNVMVTSAFDGSIIAWDLSSHTENNMLHDKILLMNGLMRTKLSPDCSKMVISTTSGYMIIIHHLNLTTLSRDFKIFWPVLYRLMQTTSQSFPSATVGNHLFHPSRKRNRVEIVDDFTIDAEVISSLQIHPHGWNAVSRSLSEDGVDEVTSVHDIQERDDDTFIYAADDDDPLEESPPHSDDHDDTSTSNSQPTDLWIGLISNYQRERQVQMSSARNFVTSGNLLPTMGVINSGLIGSHRHSLYFQQHPEEKNKIVMNGKRLTHYAKEKNVGRGYIKELCYSKDGRIICSPFDKGVRLLGFSDNYEEVSYCVPSTPKPLQVLVELKDYHPNIVVSCKFNPVDFTMVSGCLDGKIVWYKPIF